MSVIKHKVPSNFFMTQKVYYSINVCDNFQIVCKIIVLGCVTEAVNRINDMVTEVHRLGYNKLSLWT